MELDQVEENAKLCECEFIDISVLSCDLGLRILVRTHGAIPTKLLEWILEV